MLNALITGTIASDPKSGTGNIKPTEYQAKDGTNRHGLSLTATAILSAYQVRQRRGDDQGKTGGKGNTEHVLYSDREQNQAYADFARQAARPAHDDTFDSEVPF